MLPLSYLFYILSRLYLFPFLKLNILIIFETLYNIIFRFTKTRRIYQKSDLPKQALITGGTKGIGHEIVKKLISLNYNIILLSRDISSMSKLQQFYGESRIKYSFLDLSNLKSITKTISSLNINNLDLLINNAGVYHRKVIKIDGIESNLLINFIGHYLITEQVSARRVVNVSSSVVYSIKSVKERGYDMFMENYAQSKLANLLHTMYCKLKDVECVAVHPGIVCTGLFSQTMYGVFVGVVYRMMPWLFTSVNDAAENVIYACFAKDLSERREEVDFYMYGQRAKVPDYVNYRNMIGLMEYVHKEICRICEEDS